MSQYVKEVLGFLKNVISICIKNHVHGSYRIVRYTIRFIFMSMIRVVHMFKITA